MSKFQLEQWLPTGSIIKGELLSNYEVPGDLALLDQDILEVTLPTGQTIDVGWFPQNQPDGNFRVVVYKGFRNNVLRTIEARTSHGVACVLQELGRDFAQKTWPRQDTPKLPENASSA